MGDRSKRIPRAEFDSIYARVPRLTVELIIRTAEGVLLSRRSIEPRKGQWHIPGGTVFFGERLIDAARGIAKDELGVDVRVGKVLGVIEYPEVYASGYQGWPVGVALEATITKGSPAGNKQGEEVRYFTQVPDDTVSEQKDFLDSIGAIAGYADKVPIIYPKA